MLLRQERIAFGLLGAVTVIIMISTVVLGGLDRSLMAEEFREDIPDGILSRIEGEIVDLQPTRTGGHLTARVEDVRIFIPATVAGNVALKDGDRVRIIGTVQTYQGKKEIVVQSADDIMVHEREENLTDQHPPRQ